MKKQIILLAMLLSLVLSGCSWLDGSYVSVTPHKEQSVGTRNDNLTASNHEELIAVLESVIAKGTESCVINALNYDSHLLTLNMENAAQRVQKIYPVGAYAVESLDYEIGTNSGKTAIAVEITYRHNRTELRQIQTASDLEAARDLLGQALENYDSMLVMQIDQYEQTDFFQMVQDHAMENPQSVMETPMVAWEVFGIGNARLVELTFTYQTSRGALRNMQTQVQPVFDSAVLYVSGEGAQNQKYAQLYAFLMERFQYVLETSITPAYSLLRHGVGDSRAFATVYAAMCRAAGMECLVVTGTRDGEPWTWNIVQQGNNYYHVDLLRCDELDSFLAREDHEMHGYVWDYSAYPVCGTE